MSFSLELNDRFGNQRGDGPCFCEKSVASADDQDKENNNI